MIQKIRIKNFTSCADVSLEDLGPLVVLVGRNGAGKSNILKAISLAAKSATSTNINLPQITSPEEGPTTVTLSIAIDGNIYRYHLEYMGPYRRAPDGGCFEGKRNLKEQVGITVPGAGERISFRREGDRIHLAGGQSVSLPPIFPALAFLSSFLPQGDPRLEEVRPLFDYLKKVRYYTLDEPHERDKASVFINDDVYNAWITQYKSTNESTNSVIMRLLHMSFQQPEELQEVKSLLGTDGLRLIDDLSVQSIDLPSGSRDRVTQKLHFIRFRPIDGPEGRFLRFEFDELSLGTRRVIEILVSLIFDKSSVMLIEHPEDGIHSGLTRKLIGLLESYANPSQLFLASHSLVVFDQIKPEAVRLVRMEAGRTVVRPLQSEEITAAHRYISEDGPFSGFLELMEPE
ncbi:MAG: hypothetical protein NVSMB9_16070 [Isosphaeraceae bacterium]